MAQITHSLCQQAPKRRTGRILGYVAQKRIPRARIQPATPHFLWRAARPAHGGGQRWVHRGPRGKKIIFSKAVPRPLGMLIQVFLGRFEPVVTRFGPLKIPKCLEYGLFWDQKWVKNGSRTLFSKSDPRPFGMLKQVFLAHFEPVGTGFGPRKIPKCLEKGLFETKNGSKMAEKCAFPKLIPDPSGCSNKRFQPSLSPR